MYKRITSLSTILLLAACAADSQPETVAVNSGDAAVPIDVGHLLASAKGQSGQFDESGQPAIVSLPQVKTAHVETGQVETAMAVPEGEARVQLPELFGSQPGSVSPEVTETPDEPATTQTVNEAEGRPLDLWLDFDAEADSWSSEDGYTGAPIDKPVKNVDLSMLFDRRASSKDQELSFSFVPTLKPDQELAWTRFPELDGGSVNFEVKTR